MNTKIGAKIGTVWQNCKFFVGFLQIACTNMHALRAECAKKFNFCKKTKRLAPSRGQSEPLGFFFGLFAANQMRSSTVWMSVSMEFL